MTGEALRDRAARVGAALQRWAEGRMAEDIVPALVAEAGLVIDAIRAEQHGVAANQIRREVQR